MNTFYKIYLFIAMCTFAACLWLYYDQMSGMYNRVIALENTLELSRDRIRLLENKIKFAIRVADGIVFLEDDVSKFSFSYDDPTWKYKDEYERKP